MIRASRDTTKPSCRKKKRSAGNVKRARRKAKPSRGKFPAARMKSIRDGMNVISGPFPPFFRPLDMYTFSAYTPIGFTALVLLDGTDDALLREFP